MGHILPEVIRRCLELVFHWTVAGIILAVWGVLPEHVVADIFRSAPEWVTGQIARLPFALGGLGLIGLDVYLRMRRPQAEGYKITHNSDGTSDIEGLITFPYNSAQFMIKIRLP